MIQEFQKLGAEIERIWLNANYNEDVLPQIAEKALKEADLPGKISAWEIIEWTLRQTQLPDQRDVHGNFGDPPITLYNSPRFHIDVYFWLDGTTSLHQHAFCGAFQVLHGSSIHSHYEFETLESINIFTEIGKIKLKSVDLLEIGDVKQIKAGRQYIHGLFHLEQPSATIVVRTHKSPLFMPQHTYYKPHLAVSPFFEDATTIKKLQSLSALFRTNHPQAEDLTNKLLETADFHTTFLILSAIKNSLKQNKLDEMFNPDAAQNRFESFLETAKRRHGKRAEIFAEVFQYMERIREIVKRRSYITEPEHRFFLALLMNVEGRKQIFSLVKERFPDSEPLDKVLNWILDLSQTRVLGLNIPNALGIADFGNLDLVILEYLLEDMSAEEIRKRLKTEIPPENFEQIGKNLDDKIENIRRAEIFQPLLTQ